MDSAQHTVPTAHKDLSKVVKRKRSRSVRSVRTPAVNKEDWPDVTVVTPAMDIESLLATLSEDTALMNCTSPPPQPAAPPPQQTKVCYYSQPEKVKKSTEPRLLIRQAYKLAAEACAVVGLESVSDYKPSIYIVTDQSSVSLNLSDLVSLRSNTVVATVERYLNETNFFKPLYMNKCIIESSSGGTITISNYHVDGWWKTKKSENHIVKDTEGITLSIHGWNSLKRYFDCIESYYSICTECSATVDYLMDRYAQFFVRHYRYEVFNCNKSLSAESIQRISCDLPLFLQELNEKR